MKTRTEIWVRVIAGAALITMGALAIHDLNAGAATAAAILPLALRELIWFGPALVLLGALVLLRGFDWGRRILSRKRSLVAGLVMFATGVGTWFLTLVIDPGGDASWAYGMFSIMVEICIGLPGLALLIAGFFLKRAPA